MKCILNFLKDEEIPEQTIMRIIKKVEPYILSPITLRPCIHEVRKYNSMSIIDFENSENNFLMDLLVLGIDLTDESISRNMEHSLLDN